MNKERPMKGWIDVVEADIHENEGSCATRHRRSLVEENNERTDQPPLSGKIWHR